MLYFYELILLIVALISALVLFFVVEKVFKRTMHKRLLFIVLFLIFVWFFLDSIERINRSMNPKDNMQNGSEVRL